MALTSYLGYGSLVAACAAITYANLPTRLTIGAIVPTADYLAKGRLTPFDKNDQVDHDKTFVVRSSFLLI